MQGLPADQIFEIWCHLNKFYREISVVELYWKKKQQQKTHVNTCNRCIYVHVNIYVCTYVCVGGRGGGGGGGGVTSYIWHSTDVRAE